jgi:hypothetical protein
MTSINAMKKKISQLEAEKAAIIAKVSETTRRNADARKYALGGALLKLAVTDPRAYEVLKQAWAMGQKDKPRAFEDASIPAQEKPLNRGTSNE